MDDTQILDDLLDLLTSNGITVRKESLGGQAGGYCSVKGQTIFFLDSDASAADSAAVCAEAVAELLDTENLYIRPAVRQLIEKYRRHKKN
jgi:hypothetical protein